MRRLLAALPLLLCAAAPAPAKLHIVAAEAVYGDIARQVGGAYVEVTSLLTNPAADPHEFEPTPSAARAVAQADITITNGLGYDGWMSKLIAGAGFRTASDLLVSDVIPGSNRTDPHLWFDIATMQQLDIALVAKMRKHDPAHGEYYQANGDALLVELGQLAQLVSSIRADHAGEQAAETEPVFDRMLSEMGLQIIDAGFAIAVQNGTEPRASDTARLQSALESGHVAVLINNAQVIRPATQRMENIARAHHVPVVQVPETLPAAVSYQAWIADMLRRFSASVKPAP